MPRIHKVQTEKPEVKRTITVGNEDGEALCEVEISSYDSVRDVKERISKVLNAENQQELRHNTRFLNDDLSMVTFFTGDDLHFVVFEADPDKMESLEHLRRGGSLKKCAEEFRGDRDVVLLAASIDIVQLQHASVELRSDPEFMADCMAISTTAMYYMAADLWDDDHFVTQSLECDGTLLESVSDRKKIDPDTVMMAVQQAGLALQFAPAELRDDWDIVHAAVTQKGTALKFASIRLKNDRDVVLTAVRNDKVAFAHASRALKQDPEVVEARETQRGNLVQKPVENPGDIVKRRFKQLDKNGDGFLDFDELEELLRQGNPDIADWEVQLLFDTVDASEDGRVEFQEFCDFVFASN